MSAKGIITNFAGLRASCEDGDFVVGPVEGFPGFFNAACIDSPGLSSAPAIATYLSCLVAEYLHVEKKTDFDPLNNVSKSFADMNDKERAAAVANDARMGEIVCRCCEVTEAEVVRALSSPVPALTLDAVKWRCRATMGRCHGGLCTPSVLHIMSRELRELPEKLEKSAEDSRIIAQSRSDYLDLAQGDTGLEVSAAVLSNDVPVIRVMRHDIVIVGGGAAGLAASRAASSEGASVLLIDRESRFGGILKQCVLSIIDEPKDEKAVISYWRMSRVPCSLCSL